MHRSTDFQKLPCKALLCNLGRRGGVEALSHGQKKFREKGGAAASSISPPILTVTPQSQYSSSSPWTILLALPTLYFSARPSEKVLLLSSSAEFRGLLFAVIPSQPRERIHGYETVAILTKA